MFVMQLCCPATQRKARKQMNNQKRKKANASCRTENILFVCRTENILFVCSLVQSVGRLIVCLFVYLFVFLFAFLLVRFFLGLLFVYLLCVSLFPFEGTVPICNKHHCDTLYCKFHKLLQISLNVIVIITQWAPLSKQKFTSGSRFAVVASILASKYFSARFVVPQPVA